MLHTSFVFTNHNRGIRSHMTERTVGRRKVCFVMTYLVMKEGWEVQDLKAKEKRQRSRWAAETRDV